MHTEAQIRAAIKPLVELYGELNTTEINEHLQEVLDFDEEDFTLSTTRPGEKMIEQRVRNIIAHQKDSEKIKIYPEGFIIDKNTLPARIFAIRGINGKEEKISNDEIKHRQQQAKKRRIYKKINWELENERRTHLGSLGEEFVFLRELELVKSFDKNSANRVIHLSAKQGDWFGYDIASINEKGETVFIEVKTTKSGKDTPFFMSKNEKNFFEENINNNVFIYRVYNFNEDDRTGIIKIISAKDLFENYDFDPISFLVTQKK